MKKILVIDNYDSFTYNIVQQVKQIQQSNVVVKRNDEISDELPELFDMLIISPGPKTPKDAGVSKHVINKYYKNKPILGVCLGMQCINEILGGKTVESDAPTHGKVSVIKHTGEGLFKGIPQNIKVARYHSLLIDELPADLKITAFTTFNGREIPMALQHKNYPLFGVQFHTESFLTEYGNEMMKNFIKI